MKPGGATLPFFGFDPAVLDPETKEELQGPCEGYRRDQDDYYWLTGRVDDVMNCSGHRLGTSEIESALVLHEAVAEAAVVGFPHDIKGEGIYCYVTLKQGFDYTPELKGTLKQQVRKEIGAFATP